MVAVCAAEGQAQRPEEQPVFRSATAAVTVDVVVRDRKGQPVAGLTQADFEVLEDGVPQRILSLEERQHESHEAGEASDQMTPLVEGGSAAQAIVALVFHQLSQQSRVAAVDAARSMVESLAPDEFAGVFEVNLATTIHAPFTRDRAALEGALDAVLKSPPVQRGPAMTATGVAETSGAPGAGILTTADKTAGEMRERMASDGEWIARAGAQVSALSDLIARLARFPGRKSIVLLSEGLDVTPRMETVAARAIAENVTVYSLHAGGLGAAGRIALPDRSVDRGELTSTSQRGRRSGRNRFPEQDPTRGLAPLASYTGGFLISDTNDITAALASINAARRAYYVLAYSSSNDELDGTTRRIEVRVKRPAVSVRARSGYVAARPELR